MFGLEGDAYSSIFGAAGNVLGKTNSCNALYTQRVWGGELIAPPAVRWCQP